MNNCLGDQGYTAGETTRADAVKKAALVQQAASLAIAIDNANRLIENMRMQRDIARRSTNIAEQQHNQIATVFWPREEQFLNEFANPEPLEVVEDVGRRISGRLVAGVAGKFAIALAEARCNFRRYCTSANRKTIQDLMLARSTAIANARVLGRNIAFADFQARNDVNYNQRFQAVAVGRGLMGEAMSLYSAAGQGLAAVGKELSGSVNSALNEFGRARGNYMAANERLANLESGNYVNPYAQYGTVQNTYMPAQQGQYSGSISGNYDLRTNTFTRQGDFYDLGNADTMTTNDPYNNALAPPIEVNRSLQFEQWNTAEVGNKDLVRDGTYIYPVQGNPYGGFVQVQMSDFAFKYADHKTEGDKQV